MKFLYFKFLWLVMLLVTGRKRNIIWLYIQNVIGQ